MAAERASRRSSAPRAGSPPIAAVLGRGELGTSLLYVFPLFLVYDVGVLFTSSLNGVDFVSRHLYALVGRDRSSYLLLHLGLAVCFGGAVVWARRRPRGGRTRFVPMLLESAIYALTLGSLILFVMTRLLGIDPALSVGPSLSIGSLARDTVLSLGAGVHEELVFRLGLLSGGAAVQRALGVRHGVAMATAFVVSSVLFSVAHHVGPAGDPWALGVFTYRLLAGLAFAAIYYWRSLAHAVYAHALYDVYVLVLR